MKTILWSNISANGNYLTADGNYQPKIEMLNAFQEFAPKIGNYIIGRKTFEIAKANNLLNYFEGLEIVIVSSKDDEIAGVKIVGSPKEALDYLQQKGFEAALVGGGAILANSYLAEKLIDEAIFLLLPVLTGKSTNILLPDETFQETELLSVKEIGGGIIQTHYKIIS